MINTDIQETTIQNAITKSRQDWRTVRFGDVVRNVQVNIEPDKSGLERYVAGEHMETDNLHIRQWGTIGDGYLGPAFHRKFTKGQVLYGSRRTYLRKVAIAEFDGICANTTFTLEANEDELLPELLPFIMQTEAFTEHSIKQSRGSVNPYVNWKDLEWYEFALPPKDEQRRIAEILWAADESIQQLRVVLNKLDKLKNLNSLRAFDASNKQIKTCPCTLLCDEITVGIVVTPAKYYVSHGIPALRSLNVFPDRFVLDEIVYLSDEGHMQHVKSQLHEGDVVIVRSGRAGDAAVVTEELEGYNCIDLIIVRPNSELRAKYLSRFLNSSIGQKQLYKGTAGTAQKHFNVGALKVVNIPVLTTDEQDNIITELDIIDEHITKTTKHVERVGKLKNILLNKLLLNQEV